MPSSGGARKQRRIMTQKVEQEWIWVDPVIVTDIEEIEEQSNLNYEWYRISKSNQKKTFSYLNNLGSMSILVSN
jgi:hypothetical protein